MKKFTNFLRVGAGKNSVPKNYKKHLSLRNKSLGDFYNETKFDSDVEGKVNKERRHVVWAEAYAILDAVLDRRG